MIIMNKKNKQYDVRNDVARTGVRIASIDSLIDRLEEEKDNLNDGQIKRLRRIIPQDKNIKYRGSERPDKW